MAPANDSWEPSVVHEDRFRVRYYECDAFGVLHSVMVVRWMQEAAFRASAAVGYDDDRYHELGGLWLIRETRMEYVSPLLHGTEVGVRTWVSDFRRTRSMRRYEFTDLTTGEIAVRATTDWVYVDVASLQPAPVPECMQAAFMPEGPPQAQAARARLPRRRYRDARDASVATRVEWPDIDAMWHVNNAVYVRYIEDASAAVRASAGWSTSDALERGLRVNATEHWIEYRQPAMLGDGIDITVRIPETAEDPAWLYEIRRRSDNALLVRASAVWSWQHESGEAIVGTPTRLFDTLTGQSAGVRPVPYRRGMVVTWGAGT